MSKATPCYVEMLGYFCGELESEWLTDKVESGALPSSEDKKDAYLFASVSEARTHMKKRPHKWYQIHTA